MAVPLTYVKVNTTTAEADLAFGDTQHCIVRAPSGRLWVLYLDSNGFTGDMLAAYSDDSGGTWTCTFGELGRGQRACAIR